jgi:hypothetical protein
MNIPQTSIQMYFNRGVLGMLAFAGEARSQISRIAAGIIYYGRVVVQSRLSANNTVCRMPRSNKFTQAFTGTMSAGSVVTVITSGKAAAGEVSAVTSSATITTGYSTNLATTMGLHATAIAAAMADCYSCAYAAGTLTYIGDCDDVTAVTTTFTSPGSGDSAAAAAAAITTQDAASDILGIAYLTNERQQQLSTGYSYYDDKEPVNILQRGTVWTNVEEAVTPASTVYARLITSSTNYAGYLGASADSSRCVAFTGAKFLETISAAGINPVTINLPQ